MAAAQSIDDDFRAGRVTVGSSMVASLLFEDRHNTDTTNEPMSTVADLQLSRALVFSANVPVAALVLKRGTPILHRKVENVIGNKQGRTADECYFIVSGEVAVASEDSTGRRTKVGVLRTG